VELGIGKFIIYDEAIVTEADLGVNFFLDDACLGKSRAECCVKFLQELNPDVEGEWFPREKVYRFLIIHKLRLGPLTISNLQGQDLEWMLFAHNPQNKEYALIIYTFPYNLRTQKLLNRKKDRQHPPIIGIHSAGFYSYFRTYIPGAFPIVETHPDPTATTDLRLLTPWEELKAFAADLTKDIENLSNHEHGHIPYVVLLLYYLEKWKEAHGSAPTTYKEKIAFRDMVRAGARVNNPEGGEENFDEAVAAVLKTISAPSLPSNVKEVFDYRPDEEDVRRKCPFQSQLLANYAY
jgi:amyloid beta precursor protein binding protein 1